MAAQDKNPNFENLPPIDLGNGKVRYQLTARSVAVKATRPGLDQTNAAQPIPPVKPKTPPQANN